jgi:DNA invertase Pin-like site-specific DNA recombinase
MTIRIRQFVAYLRDAVGGPPASDQLIAVRQFASSQRGEVIAEYRDGIKPPPDHSELHRALDHVRRRGATLILPRFDHIAREAAPLALLRDSGVEFVALDYPDADQKSLPLLAAFQAKQAAAADPAKATRTRRMERAKARPPKSPKPRRSTGPRTPPSLADRRKGAVIVERRARQEAERLGPRLRELRDEGLSLREIAARIVAEGETTRAGRPLSHTAVRRMLARYDEARSAEERNRSR